MDMNDSKFDSYYFRELSDNHVRRLRKRKGYNNPIEGWWPVGIYDDWIINGGKLVGIAWTDTGSHIEYIDEHHELTYLQSIINMEEEVA